METSVRESSADGGLSLLDCTLRDGGYYTAWDFESGLVDTYLRAVSRLPIGTVELGYCNPPRDGYFGKFFFLTPEMTRSARKVLAPEQSLAVMLDEKTVTPELAASLLAAHVGVVDIVRMAVAPNRLVEAARTAAALGELGFRVGVNIMYLSQYWREAHLLEGLAEVIDQTYAVSLVDSYGACTPDQVRHAVGSVARAFPEVVLGFHGHDNLGLALANTLSARDAGASIGDGTVTGIGRGPGNTKTEQLLFATQVSPLTIDYVALHEVLDAFEVLKAEYGWGTNLVYMISGAAGLPQNKVMDWLGKNRYSVPAIIQAMRGELMDDVDTTQYPALEPSEGWDTQEALIVGGGSTVREHADAIIDYARRASTTVIHANYRHLDLISRFESEQYVCVAGDVTGRLPGAALLGQTRALLIPESPRMGGVTVAELHAVKQVPPFMGDGGQEHLGPISDIGPLSLALGAVLRLGVQRVTIVGFDGYEHATSAQQELAAESQALFDAFRSAHPEVELTSGTRTRFSVMVRSVYARVAEVGHLDSAR